MIIKLSHGLEDSELLAPLSTYEADRTPPTREQIEEDIKSSLTLPLEEIGSFYLERAISSEGTVYEEVEFLVDTRFTLNGEVFLQGSGFCFNYSEYVRDTLAALDSAGY